MPSVLSSNQVRFTLLATFVAFLYRALTQRAPLLFLSTPPALPSPNTCNIHHQPILQNCEDFSHVQGTPYIFFSCDRARREWSHAFGSFPSAAPIGEIYLWNYESPSTAPVLVSGHVTLGADFHPLGLSAIALEEGKVRVFVTNQAKIRARVEVLDVELETGKSNHIKTVVNGKIHSPNGITAYNSTSFYLSNDFFMARRWSTALLLEAVLGIPGGQVLYVSLPPSSFTEEKQGQQYEAKIYSIAHVCFANGLAFDPSESRLYVTSSTHGIYTYSLPSPSEPWLAHPHSFHRTPFAPDNIFFSHAQKKLYVSGVPSVSAIATAMMSPSAPGAPSWTVELLPGLPRMGEVEESVLKREKAFRAVDLANRPLRMEERRWRSVFMDDGSTFGGVSTGGVVDAKGTYVGVSMVREGVVICGEILERRGSLPKEEVTEDKDEL